MLIYLDQLQSNSYGWILRWKKKKPPFASDIAMLSLA